MFLSDIMNAPFALDQDPNDPSFNFDAIKPPVFNENRKIVYNFKEFKYDSSGGTVDPAIPTAPTPTLTLSATVVNENQSITGTFTYDPTADITITADKGTISSIDKINGTFVYTAYDITNKTNGSDTIKAYTNKTGMFQSDVVSAQVTVVYVPIDADGTLSNSSFQPNEYYMSGFQYTN